jgi:hypothetical protein
MTPKRVDDGFANGNKNGQILGIATGNMSSLTIAPNGLEIAAFHDLEIEEPVTAQFALAQAEFFYDCSGRWDSSSCNASGGDDSEAMWHFAWRSRLRRYNRPFSELMGLAEVLAGAEAFGMAAQNVDMAGMTWASAGLVAELGDAASDGELIVH